MTNNNEPDMIDELISDLQVCKPPFADAVSCHAYDIAMAEVVSKLQKIQEKRKEVS